MCIPTWIIIIRSFWPFCDRRHRISRFISRNDCKNLHTCWTFYGSVLSGTYPQFRLAYKSLLVNIKISIKIVLFIFVGAVSASAESINYILGSKEKGKAAVLMVGGAAESLYCKPGTYRIVLKKRKGFVKLALKNG